MPGAAMQRKVAQRTCVGCGEQSAKGALLRIVRLADGSVAFDPTGRVAGRGAYVCSAQCFEQAYRTKKLQRALKTAIREEQAGLIAAEMAMSESAEMG